MKANELIALFIKQLPALLPPDFTLEEGERLLLDNTELIFERDSRHQQRLGPL
jgi:hypothetical protein